MAGNAAIHSAVASEARENRCGVNALSATGERLRLCANQTGVSALRFRHIALPFAALLLCTAPALADEIACSGVLGADATLAGIETAYGKDNVVTGEVPGPEGTTMIATTVFPNDPDKMFMVYWWDEEKHERIAGFTVAKNDTAPGGVKVGMGIAEVQAINGEPFTLMGFYWDYGGSAGFQSGKLSDLPGGCFLNLQFEPSIQELGDDVANAISGDRELSSDMEELKIAAPVVTEINMGYADSEAPAD